MISIRISWIRSSRPRKIGEYLFLFAVFDIICVGGDLLACFVGLAQCLSLSSHTSTFFY